MVRLLPFVLFVSSVTSKFLGVLYHPHCEVDESGIATILLANARAVPVEFTLVCWQGTQSHTVQPSAFVEIPAVFYPNPDHLSELCVLSPETEDGKQGLYLVISESKDIVIDDWLYCDTGTVPPQPVIQFHSSCYPDRFGIVDVTLVNRADTPLYFYIECWYSWHEITLEPNSESSFQATFYRGNGAQFYARNTTELCVFWPWLNDGTQNLYIASHNAGQQTLNRFLHCKSDEITSPPKVHYTTSCEPDFAGVFTIDIVNAEKDPVTVEVLCANDWYFLELNPMSSTVLLATFNRGYNYDYPPGVCVFHTWESHVEDEVIWVFTQGKADRFKSDFIFCPVSKPPPYRHSTSCVPDTFGLVPIRLENNLDGPVVFILDCWMFSYVHTVNSQSALTVSAVFHSTDNETYPTGVCVFRPWSAGGTQGVYLVTSESQQLTQDSYIYCDTRTNPPKPIIPYEVHCPQENLGVILTLDNSEDVPVTYTVSCLRGQQTVTVQPKSTVNLTASLYDGDRSYPVTRDDNEICVFRPKSADGTQEITLSSQRPGQDPLYHMAYCQRRSDRDPVQVIYESSCIPNAKDIITIYFYNTGEHVVDFRMNCANDEYSFRLKAGSNTSLPAVFYRGDDVYYPPRTCMFKDYDKLYGDHTFITVFAENSELAFKKEPFFCQKRNPFTLHKGSYRSTCSPDHDGLVEILLNNEADGDLTFNIRCWDNDYEVLLSPQTRKSFFAVFHRNFDPRYPANTCVFTPISDTVQEVVIAIEESPRDYTVQFLHCDLSSFSIKPLIHSESWCRSDDPGGIQVNLYNDFSVPLTYHFICWDGGYDVILSPYSSYVFPAVYDTASMKEKTCVFLPWADSGWRALQIMANFPDGTVIQNVIYCKGRKPTHPPNINYHSTCAPDNNGTVTLHLENTETVKVWVLLVCQNDWFNQTLEARSTTTFPLVYNEGSSQTYPTNTCVLLDITDFFLDEQFVWLFSEKADGEYTEEIFYCSKPSAKEVVPIVHLIPHCPRTTSGLLKLELRADVPASGRARCANGDKDFLPVDEVSFILHGQFYQPYNGEDCLFYKKETTETYTVLVEIGWGEENGHIILNKEIHTVTCAYNDHGEALSSTDTISDWFLSPLEKQHLHGGNSSGVFIMKVLDALDREIDEDHISLGKKIRLRAVDPTGVVQSAKALSCEATNGVTSYPILRAGCGDGLVFSKSEGFTTIGDSVFSPYFTAFRLKGGPTVQFICRFTECHLNPCDGSSCETVRRKRSVIDSRNLVADTRQFHLSNTS